MALSVEKVRHEMLRGILIPREMVNKALLRTYEHLDAKETKIFSFKGRVTQTVEVPDYAIQESAADKIFSLAGLYAREREDHAGTPGVALEVDPRTGVVRLIVGGPGNVLGPPNEQGQEDSSVEKNLQTLELPPVQFLSLSEPSAVEAPVVISKIPTKRNNVSDSVWKVLYDETDL